MKGVLQGRLALVTGSTSGIGLGIARVLSKHGADIILNGLDPPAVADTIVSDLKANHGTRAWFSPADLRESAQVAEMVQVAEGRPVDILVNNAGIQHVSPVEEFPEDKWRSIMDINLTASFLTIKACLPKMREQGWGRIINVASVHGRVASTNKAAYVASKHGVLGLTKCVSLETVGSGVTSNALCPGWVLTPLVSQQIEARALASGTSIEEETNALLLEKQPSGKFATPEDIGELAAFLCSSAAAQITGEDIAMDGGWTAV